MRPRSSPWRGRGRTRRYSSAGHRRRHNAESGTPGLPRRARCSARDSRAPSTSLSARSVRARVTSYARCCGLLRFRAPAFDHVDAKPPLPAHAKAGNLPRAHQAINCGRMHVQILRELSYGQNGRRIQGNPGLYWLCMFHDPKRLVPQNVKRHYFRSTRAGPFPRTPVRCDLRSINATARAATTKTRTPSSNMAMRTRGLICLLPRLTGPDIVERRLLE